MDEPFLVRKHFDPRGIAAPTFILYRWQNGQKVTHGTFTKENEANATAKLLNNKLTNA